MKRILFKTNSLTEYEQSLFAFNNDYFEGILLKESSLYYKVYFEELGESVLIKISDCFDVNITEITEEEEIKQYLED